MLSRAATARLSASRSSSRSCSGHSSGVAPNASMQTNWRSHLRISTATLPASGRVVRGSQQRQPRHHPGASHCPIICRARTSCSMLIARSAVVAAARSTRSGRASARCSTGFRPSFVLFVSPARNTPAAPVTRLCKRRRLIAGGLATPALLAQVLISKYCDHTPLYRQSQIFARYGVDLSRSTLVGWVGGACWWLEALHERLCKNVFASNHLFADDTPIPVLDPGRGRTKTGRLWVYAREQRPWSGPEPPAAVYLYAPDRKQNGPLRISRTLKACCTSTVMPASNN